MLWDFCFRDLWLTFSYFFCSFDDTPPTHTHRLTHTHITVFVISNHLLLALAVLLIFECRFCTSAKFLLLVLIFLGGIWGRLAHKIISSTPRGNLFYLSHWCALPSSWLLAIARTHRTLLNESGEKRHPCLVPKLRMLSAPLQTMPLNLSPTFHLLVIKGIYHHTWLFVVLGIKLRRSCMLGNHTSN